MITVIGCSLLLLVLASIAYYRSLAFAPFALGALLGTSLNVLKVIMLDHTVKKIINIEAKNAGNYVRFQHFLRFLLTGLVFLLAVLFPSFLNIWGVAAGVLTFQIATYFTKSALKGGGSAS